MFLFSGAEKALMVPKHAEFDGFVLGGFGHFGSTLLVLGTETEHRRLGV